MAEPRVTQAMKRHAVMVSLATGHSYSEIVAFLKDDRSKFEENWGLLEVIWFPFPTENVIVVALTSSGHRNSSVLSKLLLTRILKSP